MMKKGTTALVSVVAVAGPAVIAGNQLTWGSSAAPPQSELPLADDNYVLAAEIDAYNDFMMSGGPPPDGIPSIDEPEFIDASSSELASGEMVIGYVHSGEARAYPHRILVQHEIRQRSGRRAEHRHQLHGNGAGLRAREHDTLYLYSERVGEPMARRRQTHLAVKAGYPRRAQTA